MACLLALIGAPACWASPSPLNPHFEGSVGVPHHGVQTGAEELPKSGVGFVRYRPHGKYYWGRPRLIRAVQSVAKRVAAERPGSPPLVIGDLSAPYGGKIPRHNSHRTGRDVDLLWFVTTARGAPVKNPGFIKIGSDGLAPLGDTGGYLRLDIEREWLLVKELLLAEDIDVQWLFCSRDIEALLIDYARARGEDIELIWRAETVLLQPGDSLPHDDHLHLRIACSPDETLRGCQGGGPHWEWLEPLPALGPVDDALLSEIANQDPYDEPEQTAASDAEEPDQEAKVDSGG